MLESLVYSANVSANMQVLLRRFAVVADFNPGLFIRKAGAAVTAARRVCSRDRAEGRYGKHQRYCQEGEE